MVILKRKNNMIKIHAFDLLYKLWYRGCFYKNRKVRRSMLGLYDKRPRTEWVVKGVAPVDIDFVNIWIMQFEIIAVILLIRYSGWSFTVVSCIFVPMMIIIFATPFVLGYLWKDKNWYFNEEKLKELNKVVANEDLIWPIRVLNYLLYIIFAFLIFLLPIISFIEILVYIH